jgi:hypothetical protein
MELRPGNPQWSHNETIERPTLEDLGIDKSQSHRYQTIASLPQEVFEAHIADTKAAGNEFTSSGTYVKAHQQHRDRGH